MGEGLATTILSIVDDWERPALLALWAAVGFALITAPNLAKALRLVRRQRFDALILTESLMDSRSPEIVELLRNVTALPLLVLGSESTVSLCAAFQAGADDYVSWKQSGLLLKARLASLVRRDRLRNNGAYPPALIHLAPPQ